MTNVYCKKDYDYYSKGYIYLTKTIKNIYSGTYSLSCEIYDINENYIGFIGYLFPEIFETIKNKRKSVVKKLLYEI